MTVREMFERYLRSQCQGIQLDIHNQYHCWYITQEFPRFFYSTFPTVKLVEKKPVEVKSYIWIGPHGVVYRTLSSVFEKKKDQEFEEKMRVWCLDVHKNNFLFI